MKDKSNGNRFWLLIIVFDLSFRSRFQFSSIPFPDGSVQIGITFCNTTPKTMIEFNEFEHLALFISGNIIVTLKVVFYMNFDICASHITEKNQIIKDFVVEINYLFLI